MMHQGVNESRQQELLNQLIGEWSVGVAMKTSEGKIVSGCGEMTAVKIEKSGINLEINSHIEGYDDYYESDLWSIDPTTNKIHLYSVNSEGNSHDHIGEWKDNKTLELIWRGTFEDQEREERIIAKWVDENQIELKETIYSLGKPLLITDYVFKRKQAI